MARRRINGGKVAPGRGQMLLPFSHVRNRGLFSNHWFENRLTLEPEWNATRETAKHVLEELLGLWGQESNRVERYGAEAPLEHAFIQPVFQAIGWKLVYQTWLEGREPDYALFVSENAKDVALRADRTSPDFWPPVAVVADAPWQQSRRRPNWSVGRIAP
jgi:hypothetical protein